MQPRRLPASWIVTNAAAGSDSACESGAGIAAAFEPRQTAASMDRLAMARS
jgi:hypothetical protein